MTRHGVKQEPFSFFLLRGRWLGEQTSSPRREVAQLLRDRCSMEQGRTEGVEVSGTQEFLQLTRSRLSRLSGWLMGLRRGVTGPACRRQSSVTWWRTQGARLLLQPALGGREGKAVNQVKDPTEFLLQTPHTSPLESLNRSDHTHSVSAAPHGIHFPFIFLGSKCQCPWRSFQKLSLAHGSLCPPSTHCALQSPLGSQAHTSGHLPRISHTPTHTPPLWFSLSPRSIYLSSQ